MLGEERKSTSPHRILFAVVLWCGRKLGAEYGGHIFGTAETGTLGDEERVTVTEDSNSSATFTGRIKLQSAASRPGDGSLQYKEGTKIKASHGFGYLGRHAMLKP